MKKLNYLYKSIMNELNNATLKAPRDEDLGIDLIGSTDTTIPAYLRQGRNQIQNEVRSQYPVSSDWNAQSNADLAAAELARLQQARETYANDPMHLYARSVSQDDVDLAAARAAGHAANAQATSTARDNQATAMRIYDQGLARERARQINPGVVGPLLDKQVEDRGSTVTAKRRMPDGTLVPIDYEPRPKLSLDGELSPGVEDELLARIYPDHPDSIAYRKGTKTASVANNIKGWNNMNKALLIEAIMSSDMKSTTKSFLVSVLKSPAGEDSTAVSTTAAPRPRLALDGELSPGVEDEILAKKYPDHPDSVLWRKQNYPDFYDMYEDLKLRQNTMRSKEYRDFMATQPEGADLFDRTQNLGPAYERFVNERHYGRRS